jgi:hypothetical protein
MSAFEEAVVVSRRHLGGAGLYVVTKVLERIGRSKDEFTKADLIPFADAVDQATGVALTADLAKALKTDLMALAKGARA